MCNVSLHVVLLSLISSMYHSCYILQFQVLSFMFISCTTNHVIWWLILWNKRFLDIYNLLSNKITKLLHFTKVTDCGTIDSFASLLHINVHSRIFVKFQSVLLMYRLTIVITVFNNVHYIILFICKCRYGYWFLPKWHRLCKCRRIIIESKFIWLCAIWLWWEWHKYPHQYRT